jgi:hypothetical protein
VLCVLVAGFLQKKGGGTSLLGSKAWAQRYIRIEVRFPRCPPCGPSRDGVTWFMQNGNLSWWKRKEDAVSGVPPQKGARIRLADFFLDITDTPVGKYFCFKIVAKDKSSLTTP